MTFVSLIRATGLRWIVPTALLAAGCQSVGERKPVGAIYPELEALPAVYAQSFDAGRPEGWIEEKAAAWRVADGRYQVRTKDDEALVSLCNLARWTNVFAEVTYVREATSVGAGGLAVRATPDFRGWSRGAGYLFGIGSDGATWQYAVYRQVGGVIEFLQGWTTNAALQAETNRLAVLARGDLLQFYANGALLWEGYDDALAAGYLGLFGNAAPGQEVLHRFDDVAAREAPAPVAPAGREKKAGRSKAEGPATPLLGRDKSPLLRPGLLVRVTVYASGKREIDAEVKRVSDNNRLDLPLIGPVSVEGMTLSELNATLQVRYQDYFIDPQVLAEFVVEERPDAISPWGSVVVLGRVKTPGRVNIPPTQDLTVSGAIQQAGGLDSSARASSIRLTRRKPDGGTERVTIDFTAVGSQGSVENDLLLKPGDLIFVPESVF